MIKKKVNIRREDRKILLDKKTGNISNLQVPKITALYYYQFLKLLTELEDMKYVLKVEQRKKGLKVGDKLNARVKINKSVFRHIDFDWIRRQPSLFNLKVDMNIKNKSFGKFTSKNYSKSAFKFFDDNKHLFETLSCSLVRNVEDIDDDNYYTVKIPKFMTIESIKYQITLLKEHHEFHGRKSLTDTFDVKDKSNEDYDRLFRVFILREKHQIIWKDICTALGYGYSNLGKKYDDGISVKSAQRVFEKCKYLLYNLMTENRFGITSLK